MTDEARLLNLESVVKHLEERLTKLERAGKPSCATCFDTGYIRCKDNLDNIVLCPNCTSGKAELAQHTGESGNTTND